MISTYILVDGNPVAEPDITKWAAWMENPDSRKIAKTECGEVLVSTVFLGTDHSFGVGGTSPAPILYETMVFGLKSEEDFQERYTTKADALLGHATCVLRVLSRLSDGEGNSVAAAARSTT